MKLILYTIVLLALAGMVSSTDYTSGTDTIYDGVWNNGDTVEFFSAWPNPVSSGTVYLDSGILVGHTDWDGTDYMFIILRDDSATGANAGIAPGNLIAWSDTATVNVDANTIYHLNFNGETFSGDSDSLWVGVKAIPNSGNSCRIGKPANDADHDDTHYQYLNRGGDPPASYGTGTPLNNGTAGPIAFIFAHTVDPATGYIRPIIIGNE